MFSFLASISFLIIAVWKAKANMLMKVVFERGDQKEHYCCFWQIKSGWKITHPLGHLPFSGGSFRIHIISSTIWKATLNFFTLITSCSKTNKNWNLWLPSESVHVCSFKKNLVTGTQRKKNLPWNSPCGEGPDTAGGFHNPSLWH